MGHSPELAVVCLPSQHRSCIIAYFWCPLFCLLGDLVGFGALGRRYVICFLTGQTLQALCWVVREDPSVLDYTFLFVLSLGMSSLGLGKSCQASQKCHYGMNSCGAGQNKNRVSALLFLLGMGSWGLYQDLMFFPAANCRSSLAPPSYPVANNWLSLQLPVFDP